MASWKLSDLAAEVLGIPCGELGTRYAALSRMTRERVALSLVWCLAAGCGLASAPGELLASSKARVVASPSAADLSTTVAGNSAFAIDVYRKLVGTSSNVVFSPYSLTLALSMAYGGAKGATASAFESTLHVGQPPESYHRGMNAIDAALRSRGGSGRAFRLSVENQLFAQKGFSLVDSYLDLLATEYGAGVRELDFASAAEAARQAINGWVKSNTEGLIPELLKAGAVDADTVLALVNTVYFNAAWMTKFPHEATRPGSFELLDGTTKTVPMMSGKDLTGGAAVVDGTDVLELPYEGDELSMILLVPTSGRLGEVEAGLSPQVLDRYVGALQRGPLSVQMPKFSFSQGAGLKELLSSLGLGIAFTEEADFGAMSPERIAVSDVIHEAVIRTDEDGTVAAAATAVTFERLSLPQYRVVNRPFIFLIRDRATGALVFMGRVVDPS